MTYDNEESEPVLDGVEERNKTVSFETEERIIAVVRLLAMLGSTAATAFGFAVGADAIELVLLCACAIAAIVWGWWFNSNWTAAAAKAQRFLNAIKAEEKGEE